MAYLDNLSFYDAVRFILYVIAFGMFIRFGFHYADWILTGFKDFLSGFKKDRP